MSHEDLRKRAVKWLTARNCGVVLSEMVSLVGETPDAIGWKGGHSILVECKTSRSDFRANADKCFNRIGRGVGRSRYYFCPKGLISESDVIGSDYGLLWLRDSGNVQEVVKAPIRETDWHAEVIMLTSALRRVRTREFLTINLCCEATELKTSNDNPTERITSPEATNQQHGGTK